MLTRGRGFLLYQKVCVVHLICIELPLLSHEPDYSKTQAGIVYLKFTVLIFFLKKLYVNCLLSLSSSCQLQSSSLTVCGITYLKPYKQNNSSSSPDSVK